MKTQKNIRAALGAALLLSTSFVFADGRLEGYRRLAAASTEDEVDDVIVEWEDRYGPLPPEAEELIAVARLRVEALRIGLDELVQARGEIRISPVDLRPSQEVRLERIQRGAVLRGEKLFIPAPKSDVAKALHTFLQTMWPETAG